MALGCLMRGVRLGVGGATGKVVVGAGAVGAAGAGTGGSMLERPGGGTEKVTKATFCEDSYGFVARGQDLRSLHHSGWPPCLDLDHHTNHLEAPGFDFCLPEAEGQYGWGSGFSARQS